MTAIRSVCVYCGSHVGRNGRHREAAVGLGRVRVVTSDVAGARIARELGADVVADPGGGQGGAVRAGLAGVVGACLVVNADLPCATTESLRRLEDAVDAFVAATDGTTNALHLSDAGRFVDVYGPGSAARFAAGGLTAVSIPELAHDVDTRDDLARLPGQPGRRTALVVSRHELLMPTGG